jgi:PAS domain S-box-containing protein
VWLILPLLLIGLALSVYSFQSIYSTEQEELRVRFQSIADAYIQMIEGGIKARLGEVDSLRHFLEGSVFVAVDEFRGFTESFIARDASEPAIMWIQQIPADERREFEADIRSEGTGRSGILERGAGEDPVSASSRAVYYPIRYVEPAGMDGMVVGIDFGSDPARLAAIQKARDIGEQVVLMSAASKEDDSFQIFSPVYRMEGDPPMQQSVFQGVVACSYCWKDIVEDTLSQTNPVGFDVEVSDITDSGDRRLLYLHVSRTRQSDGEFSQDRLGGNAGLSKRYIFSMADRKLEIVCAQAPLFDGGGIAWPAWILLFGGLLATGLLAIFFHLYQVRTKRIAQLVHLRTQELNESTTRLELILSGAELGYWDWNIQTGEMTFSEGWVGLVGYSLEELTPDVRSWQRLVHPDDKAKVLSALRQHFRKKDSLFEVEHRLRHRDGHYVWVLNRGRVIERDAEGKALRACGTHLDISVRKQAGQARDLLAAAVEQFGESLVITDKDARIQYVNAAFERTSGYTRKEVTGKFRHILLGGYENDQVYQEIMKTIESGRTWQGVIDSRKKDGTQYFENATISPVFDWNGNIVNHVCVRHPLADGDSVDQQRQRLEIRQHRVNRMESIGRLAGGVAHDLNNLLGPILGYSEMLLRKTDPDEKIYTTLKSIHESGIRARDVVRQLLAFGRKLSLSVRTVDLTLVVKGFKEKIEEMMPENIETRFTFGASLIVKADIMRLEQVLVNLADNARDAMPEGGIFMVETFETTLGDSPAAERNGVRMGPGLYALLVVSDTGKGMDEKILENIFEPFFSTKEGGSTGLGLAMAYGTVKQHGGYIWADSEVGKGTKFEIYLPIVAETETFPDGHGA